MPSDTPTLTIASPYTAETVAVVPLARVPEIHTAVQAAQNAADVWGRLSLSERAKPLQKLRDFFARDLNQLAALISAEAGKTPAEAKAELEKSMEVMDFALGMPAMDFAQEKQVSRGITCAFRREPLGVVVGITPFNFPAMVAFWMIPNALMLGNSFVWKPSEKVSQTPQAIGELFEQAGFPKGVLTILNGGRLTVEALCDHPQIAALGFVGSTPVARAVYQRATAAGKRALCLGGAKNHLIVLPDADTASTASAIVDSFTGCAGQRCMAGSVMVVAGKNPAVVDAVVEEARARRLGIDIGCLIDEAARQRLHLEISKAQKRGAQILLDGRTVKPPPDFERGAWLGPTILEVTDLQDSCAREELFGPILTIVRVENLHGALQLEAQSPYGNASVVFTKNPDAARELAERSTRGMIGINVGIPVPREPFSFGGRKQSKFGHGDITGVESFSLWSDLKKITSKWQTDLPRHWMG